MQRFTKLMRRVSNFSASMILLMAQLVPYFVLQSQSAYAASGDMSVGAFEGENSNGSWSPGNNTQYSEGDFVRYRFEVGSIANYATSGTLNITFSTCMFTSYFAVSDPGTAGVVVGTQGTQGGDWVQPLTISLDPLEQTTVMLTLQISLTGGDCNGSSSHVALDTPQGAARGDFGNVGGKDIPIPASSIFYNPSITITKTVSGGNALPSDFYFVVSPAINGISEYHIPLGQNSVVINEVNPDGVFTITEFGPAGYAFSSGNGENCAVASDGVMTATVTAGRPASNAVCNFTNELQSGSIIIEKQTLPDGDQTSFEFDASYSTDMIVLADGQTSNSGPLSPGTYSVLEIPVLGWDLTSVTCSDGSVPDSIDLGPGEVVTCTFTNTKRASITVQKTTVPAFDPTGFEIQASATSGQVFGSVQSTVSDAADHTYIVAPGQYSVDETVPAGWAQTENTCVDVTVLAGENATCQITNIKLAKLTLVKEAIPENDGTKFPFNISITSGGSFVLDDDSATATPDSQMFMLMPGIYDVTEDLSGLPDWLLTDLSCQGFSFQKINNGLQVNLEAGDEVQCIFTNTLLGSIVGTKYEMNADGSIVGTLAGWTIELLNTSTQQTQSFVTGDDGTFSFTGLLPGSYELSEIMQPGWSQITPDGNLISVDLSAGQDSDGNVFGNFMNGAIYGYKWHDINGDKLVSGEPRLEGWTIFIDTNNNQALDTGEAFTVTDASGNYEFNNLIPGTYTVCEVNQPGWMQTYPSTATGCSSTTIDKSGERVSKNFGNQAQGSLTVIKDVVNDNGGALDYSNFTFAVNGGSPMSFDPTTEFDGQKVIHGLPVGTYTVVEIEADQNGYATTYTNCSPAVVTLNDNVVCTIKNDDKAPTLDIVKRSINDDGGTKQAKDFTMLINGSPLDNPIDSTGDVYDSTVTHRYVVAQANVSYDVSEMLDDDYMASGFVCVVSGTDNVVSNPVTLSLDSHVVCQVTNNDIAPSLALRKVVITDDGGNNLADEWVLKAGDLIEQAGSLNSSDADGSVATTSGVAARAGVEYQLSELGPEGYSASKWSCDGGSLVDDVVTLGLNENVTCWITNDDIAPVLTLRKVVVNDNGGQYTANEWTLTALGENDILPAISGVGSITDVYGWEAEISGKVEANMTYTLSENGPMGYEASAWVCQSSSLTTKDALPNDTVMLTPGSSAVCAITNNDMPATLILVKDLPNDDGGDATEDKFAVYVNGKKVYWGEHTVDAGTYEVSEDTLYGYEPSEWYGDCDSDGVVSLLPGQTKTCTITNDDIAPVVTVIKLVMNTNSGTLEAEDFTLYVDGKTVVSGQENPFEANKELVVDEAQQDGYWFVGIWGDDLCPESLGGSMKLTPGDEVTCYIVNDDIPNPSVKVVKEGPASAVGGSHVEYRFTVTNDGDVPLEDISVVDSITGVATYISGDTNKDGYLDTDETWIYTAAYTIPQDQVKPVVNTVEVCGYPLARITATTRYTEFDYTSLQLRESEVDTEIRYVEELDTKVCSDDDHELNVPQVLAEVTLQTTGNSVMYEILLGLTVVITTSFVAIKSIAKQ